MSERIKAAATALTKGLADQTKLTEAGWCGFVLALKLKDAPPQQLIEMRRAFFAGASHLFFSMLTFLEPGREETEKDMERMNKLHDELESFQKELEALAKSQN